MSGRIPCWRRPLLGPPAGWGGGTRLCLSPRHPLAPTPTISVFSRVEDAPSPHPGSKAIIKKSLLTEGQAAVTSPQSGCAAFSKLLVILGWIPGWGRLSGDHSRPSPQADSLAPSSPRSLLRLNSIPPRGGGLCSPLAPGTAAPCCHLSPPAFRDGLCCPAPGASLSGTACFHLPVSHPVP